MDYTKKKKPLVLKITLWITAVLLALAVIVTAVFFALWHNEFFTLMSLRRVKSRNDAHLDGDVYIMNVKGGFYLEEFISRGGASSDAELIDFLVSKISRGVIKMQLSRPEIGCASFTATTKSGDAVFARNYDFAKTNTCIVFTEAQGGRHATVSTVDLQFLGIDPDKGISGIMDKVITLAAPYVPLDGMNDAGVACGIYMTYQGEETVATDQNTDKPDFTSTTMLRLILDYADNIDEAIEIAASYDLHDSAMTSYHYMVADASGRSAILEWVAGADKTDNDGSKRQLKVTYNDADEQVGEREAQCRFQWVTNFIVLPGYYENDEMKAGYDRYEKMYECLNATGGVVEDEYAAMDILKTIGRRSWKNDDGNGCTVYSAVYNLTDRTVLWVSNENFTDKTAEFKFSL